MKNIITTAVLSMLLTVSESANRHERTKGDMNLMSLSTKTEYASLEIYGPAGNYLSPSFEYTFTSSAPGQWTVQGGTIISGQGSAELVVLTDYNPYMGYNNFGIQVSNQQGYAGLSYFVYPSGGGSGPIE